MYVCMYVCIRVCVCVCVCVCVWNPVTKGTIMLMQGSQGLVGYLTQRSYASKMDESMDACSCTCREFGMGDAVTACILQQKKVGPFSRFAKPGFQAVMSAAVHVKHVQLQTCGGVSCHVQSMDKIQT